VVKSAFWLGFVWVGAVGLVWPHALEAQPPSPPPLAAPVIAAPVETSPAKDAPAVASPEPSGPPPSTGQPLAATGYLLPQHDIELGILFMGYGVTDWLTVGLMPAPRVIAPILGGVSVNLSVIARLSDRALRERGTRGQPAVGQHRHRQHEHARRCVAGQLVRIGAPGSAPELFLNLRYVGVEGVNNSNIEDQEIAGTVLTRLVQVMAQAQYQLTGAVALYVQGTLQPWEQEVQVSGEDQIDDQTTATIEGEASASDTSLPWNAAVGAHFRWSAVNLRVGVGYGNIFVPVSV
jgi:hypothetical protein